MGTRTPHEGDPPCVTGGLAAPQRHHHQTTGEGEGDDAQDDEEQRGDPLRGQLRRGTAAVSAVDGLALPEQAHGQRAWMGETERRWTQRRSHGNQGLHKEQNVLWQEQTVESQMKGAVLGQQR